MDEKEDSLGMIYKIVNRSGVNRCSICNRVSTEAIETNIGDYAPHEYFTNDPKDPRHFICISCEEVIQELRDDYALDDMLKEQEQ